jgi:hypothetical protein
LVVDSAPESDPSMVKNEPLIYKSEYPNIVLLKNYCPLTSISLNTSKYPVDLIVVDPNSALPLWYILPPNIIVPSSIIFPYNADVLYELNPLPNIYLLTTVKFNEPSIIRSFINYSPNTYQTWV